MQYNVHTAKTQLSKLIDAAINGEDVVIAKGKTPVVRIVAIEKKPFRVGSMAGLVDAGALPDFLDPMGEDELSLWEGTD